MHGLNALRKLFGLTPMNEAPAAEAPAATGAAPTASAAPAAPAPTVDSSSLLSGDAPAADKPTDAPTAEGDQPAEGDKAEGEDADKDKDKDKPAEGAPETYEAFTLPEGFELDEDVLGDMHGIFKELNLPQDKANELIGKLLAVQEKQLGTPEQRMQQAEQQIIALNSRLAEECRALPEIGGEKFNESLAAASRVMQTFGTPELRSVIALTGVGSHPEFFKMMVAIGSKMAPDTFEQGGEEAQTTQRGADIMFGHLFKN